VQSPSVRQGRATREKEAPRTLVVGCGFIGSAIVRELTASAEPPVVLTRSRPPAATADLVPPDRLHIGDATDRDLLERALDDVDRVVFSAGGLLPAASERDPELDERLTLIPVLTILEALRLRPGVSLTYLSSGGTVYGEPKHVPVSEDEQTRPLGAYGELHLRCESEVLRHRDRHELPARILRCATVYGERQRPDRGQGVIATFLHRIERGEPIDLYGGGTTIRDYVYVRDVAGAVVALLGRRDGPTVLNVGSGEGTSLLEILRLAEKQVGKPAEVIQREERGFEVHRIVLDTTRLHGLVDLEITPLATGIERTHRWLATHAPEPA
jgi:UDP-glucose 4-epimerase